MPDYSMSPAAQQAAAAKAAIAQAPTQGGGIAVPRMAPTAVTRDIESLSSSQATGSGSQSGTAAAAGGGGGGGDGSAAAPKPALRSASGAQGSGFSVPNPAGQAPQRPGLLSVSMCGALYSRESSGVESNL